MIILKNTKNTQTFYVSKKCGIEPGQLPVGSYTKIEELETSKMEVFQANQPLSLHRNGEGLQLSVDLSNYATKAEIPDTSDFATKEELTAVENKIPDVSGLATKDEVALKADKSELSNYVTTDAYNTKMTELDGEISAIQAQIGNISTTLDTINGEVI